MTPENDIEASFNNPMSLKGIHNCCLKMDKTGQLRLINLKV